ncbi:hypothetical protein AB3X55_05375 [Alphaproteobacteria bacterium LSUCC0719]
MAIGDPVIGDPVIDDPVIEGVAEQTSQQDSSLAANRKHILS